MAAISLIALLVIRLEYGIGGESLGTKQGSSNLLMYFIEYIN